MPFLIPLALGGVAGTAGGFLLSDGAKHVARIATAGAIIGGIFYARKLMNNA